ncbi:MAG: metalloregulator ArsR/SmtB family transcription factor [Chloroflexi bacterium]|nr:metalloregulator ArsR/SmtB family transcription factor [Chloroflexota bacterium]
MDVLEQTGALFKTLMHPTRLAILQILRDGEECVCHMEATLGLRQAYISQQLMVLREAGLVADRRDGWNIFYRVTRPEVYAVLDAALGVVAGGDAAAARPVMSGRPKRCPCPKCEVAALH